MLAHIFNPRILEVEVAKPLYIQGHLGVHRKFQAGKILSQYFRRALFLGEIAQWLSIGIFFIVFKVYLGDKY